jgi:two-component system cell cycle response regulator CpdR
MERFTPLDQMQGCNAMARVLLAEDDQSMREFLSRALERSGHEVTAVPDGLSALNAVSERGYDLLIADIVMPGIDGIEVSRQANKVNADLKVLFITGFSAVAKSARAEMGDIKVLSKPSHLRDLVDQVNSILSQDVA